MMPINAPSRRAVLGSAIAAIAGPAGAFPVALPFGARRRPATAPLAEIRRDAGAPALAGAVVTAQGLAFLDADGRRRIDASDRVARDDQWHLGAQTKAMTAALFGKYVERGLTTWSARLPVLFPDLKLDPAWLDVRIDDVLAHRAGVTDDGLIDAAFLSAAHADTTPVEQQRTRFAQQVLGSPPRRIPGGYEYANADYVLAGAAIERLTRTSWEAAIAADLFKPLGMASAGFGAPLGANPWGHQWVEGRLSPVDPAGVADNPAVLGPGGRVHASLTDYARFIRLFLTDGGGFLQPDTLNRLGRPWGGGDGDGALGWTSWRERGWARGPVLENEGSNTLWDTLCVIGPARGVAVITASNAQSGGGAIAAQRLSLALTQMETA